MSNNSSWDFLDTLTMISFAMQIINFQENQQQSNNDDIMRVLNEQDRKYLDKILENQNKILSILSEHETDMSVK